MSDYSIGAQVIGAKELQAALESADSYARDLIKKAIDKTAIDIENSAFLNAPHKKGALRDSLHTGSPGHTGHPAEVTGDNITAVVGTNLKYARAQELGTVGMTINVPNGRKTKNGRTRPYTFRGNIKPKFYMKKGVDGNRDKFVQTMKSALQAIVNHIASSTKI